MPGSIRLFLDRPLAAGLAVDAAPGQAHYLASVMRRGLGEMVSLFNGRDGEWQARIVALRRDRAIFEVERRTREQAPELDHWLVFALLKRDATDLVVQKATELGVAAILPVFSAHTNAGRVNRDRLTAIATEAAEQSERLTVPRVAEPVALASLLDDWPMARALVAAIERADAPGVPLVAGPAALLVGPEGGFSVGELDVLRRTPFVVAASLGPRILRAETAAIVGLALLQARDP